MRETDGPAATQLQNDDEFGGKTATGRYAEPKPLRGFACEKADLRELLDCASEGIYRVDLHGRCTFINKAGAEIIGYTAEEVLGRNMHELVRAQREDGSRYAKEDCPMFTALITGKACRICSALFWRPDGSSVPVEYSARPVAEHGMITGAIITVRNITERKQLENSIRESERRFRDLLGNLDLIAMTLDCQGRVTFCNDYLLRLTGWQRHDILGADWFEKFLPASELRVRDLFFQQVPTGKFPPQYQNPILTRDGSIQEILWHNTLLRDSDGQIVGTASIGEVVTERKGAERALRESEERFRQLAENVNQVFWMSEKETARAFYLSPAFEKVWGRTRESMYENADAFADTLHPDDRNLVLQVLARQKRGEQTDQEYRIVRPDGSVRWIRDRAFPVRNAAGEFYRSAGLAEDITERKQLEAQMRQAQKMESIGQLAGGVAHDFNNILMVIQGHSSLIETSGDLPVHLLNSVREVGHAAERAAALTRQLLTFSRRQVIQPRQLHLNETVEAIAKMLRRVLGEDVELQLETATVCPVVGDAVMFEQILMNLAVNARDAMPKGGKLRISTALETIDHHHLQLVPQASPGKFVRMSVADSGCGIPPEHLGKIFEPFFTTKEVGKGTGLGLATVYGIVQQHRGWIEVESQLNKGTAFHCYFPAVTPACAGDPLNGGAVDSISGGTETILVVEDEKLVRKLVRTVLESYGYRVVEADSGPAAVQVWHGSKDQVDLLLTDLVMPHGLSGRDLAELLRLDKPSLPIIFTSGYSAEMLGEQFRLGVRMSFLQKPYVPKTLARCIRTSLDRAKL